MRNDLPTALLIAVTVLGLCSCFSDSGETAVLWTDRPEFAIYAAHFNSSQSQFKIETRYFSSPARELTATDKYPDIVAASWLKSVSTRTLFRSLDDFFKNRIFSKGSFYPRLLALGNIEGKQYLLPVAFNIPAMVFSQDKQELLSNPFTIGFEEIKRLGKEYNVQRNGVYSRMGFAPSQDDEFLFITAVLFNASFREASPMAWDSGALEKAMQFIRNWIDETNTGIQAEEDFTFKYFYDPPAKLVLSGRVFFTYMDSAALFTLAEERRTNLDFRWLAENDTIPVGEETVYYGICKQGKAKRAANAFTNWFFQPDTQRLLLEQSRNNRLLETSFGIAGGFSAVRSVTEQVFPQFYPSLLGHMPPENVLSPPNILPQNWMSLKEQVILPYLHERIRHEGRDEIRPLERRINDWHRLNRE